MVLLTKSKCKRLIGFSVIALAGAITLGVTINNYYEKVNVENIFKFKRNWKQH